jgi:hypothetical protein
LLTEICVLLLAIGFCVIVFVSRFENPRVFAAGLALGWFSSLVRIALLWKSSYGLLSMSGRSAKISLMLHTLSRYTITAMIALPAIFFPEMISLIGFFAGVMALQLAAIAALV